MFSDIFQRFIQKRPVAMMVFILLENFLNADKLDRWFDTFANPNIPKKSCFRRLSVSCSMWFATSGRAFIPLIAIQKFKLR